MSEFYTPLVPKGHDFLQTIRKLAQSRQDEQLIGFLVIALIAVGLVFNAGGVKDILLELFNKIIGA